MSAPASRRGFLSGIAVLPSLGVPVTAYTAVPIPSDLARACIEAVAHRKWIDDREGRNALDDDALAREVDKVNDVVDRAIVEPSTGIHDIAAKARLGLDRLDDGDHEPGTLLVATILREIIALGAAA